MSQDLSFGPPFDIAEMLDFRLGYFDPVTKTFFYFVISIVPDVSYFSNSIRISMTPTRLYHLLSRMGLVLQGLDIIIIIIYNGALRLNYNGGFDLFAYASSHRN